MKVYLEFPNGEKFAEALQSKVRDERCYYKQQLDMFAIYWTNQRMRYRILL